MSGLPPELNAELHSQIIRKTTPTDGFKDVTEEFERKNTKSFWKEKIITYALCLIVCPFLFLLTKIKIFGVFCFAFGFAGIFVFSVLLIRSIRFYKNAKEVCYEKKL